MRDDRAAPEIFKDLLYGIHWNVTLLNLLTLLPPRASSSLIDSYAPYFQALTSMR